MSTGQDPVLTQLRKGVLEYCVLALLRDGPTYGVEMTTRLALRPSLLSSEGTLYPLLSRLRRQLWVETFWEESNAGPPRRYYRLTPEGADALAAFARAWGPFTDDVDAVLEETL